MVVSYNILFEGITPGGIGGLHLSIMTNYVISYYPYVLLIFAIASFGTAVFVAPSVNY